MTKGTSAVSTTFRSRLSRFRSSLAVFAVATRLSPSPTSRRCSRQASSAALHSKMSPPHCSSRADVSSWTAASSTSDARLLIARCSAVCQVPAAESELVVRVGCSCSFTVDHVRTSYAEAACLAICTDRDNSFRSFAGRMPDKVAVSDEVKPTVRRGFSNRVVACRCDSVPQDLLDRKFCGVDSAETAVPGTCCGQVLGTTAAIMRGPAG